MPMMRVHFYSKALQMASVMHVVLPSGNPRQTVMLLGPGGSDGTWWPQHCLMQPLADQYDCAFVLVPALEGCGFDMAYGYRFGKSLREDVPQWLQRHMPVLPMEKLHIAGYDVCGAGALQAALMSEGRFASAACFGGCADVKSYQHTPHPYLTPKRMQCLWGDQMAAWPDITMLRNRMPQLPLLVIAPEGGAAHAAALRIGGCTLVHDSMDDADAPARCLKKYLSFLSPQTEVR